MLFRSLQLLSEEYKNKQLKKELTSKRKEGKPEPSELPCQKKEGDVKLDDLLNISSPMFDNSQINLENNQQSINNELHHITNEEIICNESSLPFSMSDESNIFDKSKTNIKDDSKEINVVDYNASGKDVITDHHLSADNEELIPEKSDAIESRQNNDKLTIIQEDMVSYSNSMASAHSGKFSKKSNNVIIENQLNIEDNKINNEENPRKNKSYCLDNDQKDDNKVFIRNYIRRAKSYREKDNQEVELEATDKEVKEQERQVNTIEEQKLHSSNKNLTNGSKTINMLPRGTGECSTMYTIDKKGSLKKQIHKLDPSFLSQMAKGTDNLSLSTAGVLFGAGPLGGYITDKGSMFQSFNTYKQGFQSGLSGNIKQVTGNSSITIKRFEDSNECSGVLKIKKREMLTANKSSNVES